VVIAMMLSSPIGTCGFPLTAFRVCSPLSSHQTNGYLSTPR